MARLKRIKGIVTNNGGAIIPIVGTLPRSFGDRGRSIPVDDVKTKDADKISDKIYERKDVKGVTVVDIPAQSLIYAQIGKKSRFQMDQLKRVKQMQSHKPKTPKSKTGRVRQHRAHGGVTRRK